MKSYLLVAVFLVALSQFAVGIQETIDCRAVQDEYEGNSNQCKSIYGQCIAERACNVTTLCSECRLLYHRLAHCYNGTDIEVTRLRIATDLMCSLSTTNNNTPCIVLFPNPNYDYSSSCILELELGSPPCGQSCTNRLRQASDVGDCCIVNRAIAKNPETDEILHTDELWSTCNATSPGKCPNPPPPIGIVATTTSPTPTVSFPGGDGGASCTAIDSSVFLLCILSALLFTIFNILEKTL